MKFKGFIYGSFPKRVGKSEPVETEEGNQGKGLRCFTQEQNLS